MYSTPLYIKEYGHNVRPTETKDLGVSTGGFERLYTWLNRMWTSTVTGVVERSSLSIPGSLTHNLPQPELSRPKPHVTPLRTRFG